jgi:hypothetical protein
MGTRLRLLDLHGASSFSIAFALSRDAAALQWLDAAPDPRWPLPLPVYTVPAPERPLHLPLPRLPHRSGSPMMPPLTSPPLSLA